MKFMKKVEEMIEEYGKVLAQEQNLDMIWTKWKNTLLTAAEEVCGTIKPARTKKATQWWTSEIGRWVKEKEKAWKKYLDL